MHKRRVESIWNRWKGEWAREEQCPNENLSQQNKRVNQIVVRIVVPLVTGMIRNGTVHLCVSVCVKKSSPHPLSIAVCQEG